MKPWVWRVFLVLASALPPPVVAAEAPLNIDLNGGEFSENRCRLTFVIENKGATAVDSLKLDLVVFNRENRVFNRLVAEMGPVRAAKTIIKIVFNNTSTKWFSNEFRNLSI